MENELRHKFESYLKEVDVEYIEATWERQSKIFRDFWTNKLLNDNYPPLTDTDIDEIVLILDKNAKGSTKGTIAVAKVMIPQGVWRRLFKEIKAKKSLRNLLFNILNENDDNKVVDLINELDKANEGQKNSLTGKSGNAINSLLFAFNPKKYTAIVSLKHRKKVIDYFNLDCDVDFENDFLGKKIVYSNIAILEGFKKLGLISYPYFISKFLYRKLKEEWIPSSESDNYISEDTPMGQSDEEEFSESKSTFYMEKELENFLISNWDRTELSHEYELIDEEGEMVSQQYQTDIGVIDILVKDKKTGQYVVIELKRNQSSDDTVGQLTRYMGWLEEHKTNGKLTKGIIIASAYDQKLYYALKKVKDVEVYTYQVDFKLKEFKRE